MRRRKTGYILLALLVITGLAGTYHSSLSLKERTNAISYLKDTRNQFLNEVKRLNDQQLEYKTAAMKWSIRECMEHIALIEKNISALVINNFPHSSELTRRDELLIRDDEAIRAMAENSEESMSELFTAPVAASYTSNPRVLDEFKLLRERNISFLNTTSADLRSHFFCIPELGVVDNYQFLLMMAAQTRRYTNSIAEIKSAPDFPK